METFVETVSKSVRDLPVDWREILLYDGGVKLANVLTKVKNDLVTNNVACSPPPSDIFNAFYATPLNNVKVILLGQDPYPNPDNAMGLSFSVRSGVTVPPSLRNIYACLVSQGLMKAKPKHGDLRYWAKQGVLLLNTALTTRASESKKHVDFWTEYLQEVFKRIVTRMSTTNGGAVLLLGNEARDFAVKIKEPINGATPVRYFHWGHPSPLSKVNKDPLSPYNFIKCTVFNSCNDHLAKTLHLAPIDWEADYTVESMAEFKPLVDKVLYVFSDGSSNNTGAGWAAVAALGERMICTCAVGLTATNNQMELTGIIKGLQLALYIIQQPKQAEESAVTRVVFVTDSQYTIGSLWTWLDDETNTTKQYKLIGNVNAQTSTRRENSDLIAYGRDLLYILKSYIQVESMYYPAHTSKSSADTPLKLALWHGNNLCDRKCGSTLRSG
jgi:uracil-DNA glycosylase